MCSFFRPFPLQLAVTFSFNQKILGREDDLLGSRQPEHLTRNAQRLDESSLLCGGESTDYRAQIAPICEFQRVQVPCPLSLRIPNHQRKPSRSDQDYCGQATRDPSVPVL